MKRRWLLGVTVTVLLLAALAWLNRKPIILLVASQTGRVEVLPHQPVRWSPGPAEAAMPAGQRPPNIVFILADDLGINDIATFGGGVAGGRVPTPNIDRLAAEGASFEQAYAGTASCAPSRAMIMTGRYPTRTGFEFTPTPDGMGRIVTMFANDMSAGLPETFYNRAAAEAAPPFSEQGLPGEEVTVAEVLREAGYQTAHIGKWHLGRGGEFSANAQGFHDSLLMASGLFLPPEHPDVVNARLDFDPIDRFLWARMQYAASFNDSPWFEPGGYLTDYWTDEAVKVIETNRHRPFFLYLAHWAVHTPLQATRADYEAVGDIQPERLRVYAAMVRALDRSVGRVLDALEAQGLADNTLVVFSSDNGGAGYVGLPDINAPYRGWKLTLFEGGIRVPMLLRWPDRIPAGARIAEPAAHIDLMPTFAAAAGAPLPADRVIDGINLLPLASGSETASSRDAVFWQSAYYRVVRQGDWKLQVTERPQRTWLFDLASDPTEQRNLADARPDKVEDLLALLDAHQTGARAPLHPHTIEAPVALDKPLGQPLEPGDEYVYWPN
jgi:arylsulfatase A-like enzyme